MTVLIKDEEADRMIRQLAERTGETITDAVKGAVARSLPRTPLSESEIAERLRRLEAHSRRGRCDADGGSSIR